MSQENVEIVRTMLAAADDREAVLKFVDPEIVIDATRNVINPETYVGFEGLERWQAHSDEVWDEIRHEALKAAGLGE